MARATRTILGIYGADDVDPLKAYESVRGRDLQSVCLLQQSGITGPAKQYCARFSKFRLDGEYLLIAGVEPSKVQSSVQLLKTHGSPAIFLLPDGPEDSVLETPHSRAGEPVADFARQFATQRTAPGSARRDLLPPLRASKLTIETAEHDLAGAARLDHGHTAAAEWLLDNGYLIQAQVTEIAAQLKRGYQKLLPVGPSGFPYIYEFATALVRHTDNSLNETIIETALREYQKSAPLTIAELWTFPLLLRMALVESLANLSLRVSHAQQLREAAYFWANRLAASARKGPEVFESILGQLENEPAALQSYFLISLAEQLQDEEDALDPVQHWIEQRIKTPITEIVRAEHTREAAECVSTANAFGALRALARIDFTGIFEAVSLVEAELRKDPAGIYPHTDFSTRDLCRRVVERISRQSGVGEIEVARRAVALAAQDSDPRTGHVSYYLLSEGIARLEAETAARKPLRTRLIRGIRKRATGVYLTGVIGLTAWFTLLALAIAWDSGIRDRVLLGTLGLLALFPLSELAIQIVNALVISLFPPDTLPKMDFEAGIPPEHATLVVVPMMLSSLEVVRREVEKLEVRYLANREPNLFFSLFSDFTDAREPVTSEDEELLQAARDGIRGLNARYPGERFLLFHRQRTWSESEQAWIGRERKRGKIEELNAFLTGEGSDTIVDVGSLPIPIRYVTTLDADTQLPPGTARRLVETIAHPLNSVKIDPGKGVRQQGYTIIQPRVSITLPGATATRFTRVFADTTGTDPYCQTVSDAQQDLFGEAIFHGKAIYEVKSFASIVGNRFPVETLLSHDLIEGAHVGVGLATDIELFENLPLDYVGYSRRQHRWIRGDWQIAPWIFSRVPAAEGGTQPNPLPAISRWRIFDNLRRSLAPAASMLLLLFGWLVSAAPGIWSLVVGLAFAIPTMAPLLERLARRLQGAVRSWQGAADELVRALVMFSFLPHQAWLSLDAIVRAMFRRYVSRRHLLEWQSAESTEHHVHGHFNSTFRQMMIISGLSLILMIVLTAEGVFGPTSLFVALWIASPALMRWLDRPAIAVERRRLEGQNSVYLRRLGRQTWRFFDDLVRPDRNWLPPDNSVGSPGTELEFAL